MPSSSKTWSPETTRIEEFDKAAATEACLAMMHNKVPAKRTDPGSFTISCSIGNNYFGKALCDPGAIINLMPKSVFQKLGIRDAKSTTVMLQLADCSSVQPEGKLEDILVQVDKFSFPVDFLILDCEADEHAPIILGRPFLVTDKVLIDLENGKLALRVDEHQENARKSLKPLAAMASRSNSEDSQSRERYYNVVATKHIWEEQEFFYDDGMENHDLEKVIHKRLADLEWLRFGRQLT
ncbi:hypothetical protein V6N12_041630 [Hibiscus sabdariffa]|uniref:Uncharacterized protein n=1 Tax=Hibiscus sabdariffa TaxID=183260 RepID=A0ABR2B022_9ROSI